MSRLVVVALLALLVGAAGCGGETDTTEAGPQDVPRAKTAKRKGLKLLKVGSFDEPVYVTAPRGDRERKYVVEQGGRIEVVDRGRRRTFLDIGDLVTAGGEQGLLSLAFAPDFSTSRLFYVYYTDKDAQQRVVEYRADSADRADPGSARLVLKMADSESNHNGGLLLFGPDGHLYIGTGDGGGGGDRHGRLGNAQNLGSPLGKLLRIDPQSSGSAPYTVPDTNPFVGRQDIRPEIYAYGLRNPWRFSFDRRNRNLAIGDVGQNEVEEVDFAHPGEARGANFGWRVFEGDDRYSPGESAPGAVAPVMTFKHSDGNCSVTGGVVVRDRRVPGAYGRYLFGDFCKGVVLSARLRTPRVRSLRKTGLKVAQLSSFGEDGRGRVYLVSHEGPVYRLAAKR